MHPAARRPHRRTCHRTPLALAVCLVLALLGTALSSPASATPGVLDLVTTLTPAAAVGDPGDTVELTATVTNASDVPSNGLSVSASGGVELVLTSAGAECAYGSCSASALAPGASITITVTATLLSVGDYRVSVTTFGYDAEDDRSNDTAWADLTVTAPATTLALTASASRIVAGQQIQLTATVTSPGEKSVYGEVVIFRQRPGDPAPVVIGRQSFYDTITFDDTPNERAVYTATFSGNDLQPSSSPAVTVEVGFGVRAAVSPTAVPPGSALALSISVLPAVAGTAVVDERLPNGRWQRVGTTKLVAGKGSMALRATGTRGTLGVHGFRVTIPGDARRMTGASEARTSVTVTGKGNARAWQPVAGTRTRPVRWNPCSPITYYVSRANLPRTGLADIQEALRRITLVNGLQFRYGGLTSARPTTTRGPGPGKVLIGWANAREAPGLSAGVAGVAWTSYSSQRMTTAVVIINRDWATGRQAGFGGDMPHGEVLMHELAHAVGLDHTSDPWSIMQPVGGSLPAAVWGAADIAGLRVLGRASGCLR